MVLGMERVEVGFLIGGLVRLSLGRYADLQQRELSDRRRRARRTAIERSRDELKSGHLSYTQAR